MGNATGVQIDAGAAYTVVGGQVLSTYTHVSDQHSTFGTKVIVATTREAQYVLDDFLGNIEVSQYTYQGSGEQSGFFSEDGCQGGMRSVSGTVVGHSYCSISISITGRISTVPPAGQVFAIRKASSRSGTLISV